jgi:hypothetical protein
VTPAPCPPLVPALVLGLWRLRLPVLLQRRHRGLARSALLVLAAAMLACDEQPPPPCSSTFTCTAALERAPAFLWVTRSGGAARDLATWRFERDEEVCEISSVGITCFRRGEPDDGTVPLFVAADVTEAGVDRRFRLDLTGRETTHLRVLRDGKLVDKVDFRPTFQADAFCPDFRSDFESERVIKAP